MTTIALAGNPNAGKSTLFNALTGSHQHVGNWPGKTVEKKEGFFEVAQDQITIVDLPGTYSLNAYSVEELIARNYIINNHPDAVLVVVDSANLERNLYLVAQILEIGIPLMLALNMSDIAASRGIHIDADKLSQKLGGIPIVRTVGYRQTGLDDIRQLIAKHTQQPNNAPSVVQTLLPPEMEAELVTLIDKIEQDPMLATRYRPRWLAIKLLEQDEDILAKLSQSHSSLLIAASDAVTRIEAALDTEPEILVAEGRYELISEWVREVVKRPIKQGLTPSDRVDRILTHRTYGLPIFLAMMWLVFQITANVSAPFLEWIEGIMAGPVTNWATAILSIVNLQDTWLGMLILDGVIVGVGGVLVFIPVLMSLYLTIAVLEDSGYMARAAFVMDRSMHRLGLQGKSFLPLMVGFGCSVPAVYATRTLENETDRKITAFLTTFMSCGARLPVYILFGAVFFGGSGTFIFAMYLIGISVAVLTSLLLTRVAFRDKPRTPFVMELPPYRTPNLSTVWRSTWHRTWSFVQGAGTLILVASLGIWLLMALPTTTDGKFNDVAPEDSVFGTVGEGIAPVFAPAGFDNWEASGALITGFLAKEVVIASMSQIYVGEEAVEADTTPTFVEDVEFSISSFGEAGITTAQELINIIPRTVNIIPGVAMPELSIFGAEDEEDQGQLESALDNAFTPLSALAFNVFILLYVPCMATVGAMRHEFGWRWALAQVGYTVVVAWVAAVLVYQIGSLLGV